MQWAVGQGRFFGRFSIARKTPARRFPTTALFKFKPLLLALAFSSPNIMSDVDNSMDVDNSKDVDISMKDQNSKDDEISKNDENSGDPTLPSPPSNESIDGYTDKDHRRMDELVAERLKKDDINDWHDRVSIADLTLVLSYVAHCDARLDTKYRDYNVAKQLLDSDTLLKSKVAEAWKAKEYCTVRKLDILRAPVSSTHITETQSNVLREALTSTYQGGAVEAFHKYLTENNTTFAEAKYYGKFCSIVQSSGTGKTRLMLELRKKGVCVLYMNIRSRGDTQGYPERDDIPANILTRPCVTEDEYRTRCYEFFAAVFKVLCTSMKDKELLSWCDNMCAIGNNDRDNFFADLDRECDNVKREAERNKCSSYKGIMRRYYQQMVGCFPKAKDDKPKVVIALDEAHVLHDKNGDPPFSPADVLLRTIKEYSENNTHAVWVVFASTTSKVAHFASPQALFNSARVSVKGQLLFPPFTQLGWNQNAPELEEVQPEEVAKVGHIIRYGHPLWVSLMGGDDSLTELLQLARQKLCGSDRFNPRNDHQALAVLAQRFGLDIAFGHRDAVRYGETLVASHLRVCIKTTEDRMWSYTTYPSEPILSCAAASLLHSGDTKDKNKLDVSLHSLESMVNDGVIDIGQIGEVVSRFLWLLAKDFYVRKPENGVGGYANPRFDQALQDCQLVPVVGFLEFVFGSRIWDTTPEAKSSDGRHTLRKKTGFGSSRLWLRRDAE
ncbi:hypothetical protein OG21DRAFT_1497931 [Imleria badia]|nr:hypothetical protein OG21DRAFT_1497931 [Imleria badia]